RSDDRLDVRLVGHARREVARRRRGNQLAIDATGRGAPLAALDRAPGLDVGLGRRADPPRGADGRLRARDRVPVRRIAPRACDAVGGRRGAVMAQRPLTRSEISAQEMLTGAKQAAAFLHLFAGKLRDIPRLAPTEFAFMARTAEEEAVRLRRLCEQLGK